MSSFFTQVDLQQLQMKLCSASEHVASSSIHLPHSLLIRLLEALATVSHKSQAYRFVIITVFLIRSILVLWIFMRLANLLGYIS